MRQAKIAVKPEELNPAIIITAALLGFFSYISPGFVFCGLLTLSLFLIVSHGADSNDRRFVFTVISLALVSRLVALIIAQYYCLGKGMLDIFGDAASNLEHGWTVHDFLTGESAIKKSLYADLGMYNVHGKTVFNGFFYTLFGNDVLSLKYLNVLSAAASGWLVYDLTRKIYSSSAGKLAMAIVLFWPTLFLWSITDLKESHLILALTAIFWSINKITATKSVKFKLIFSAITALLIIYAIFLRFKFMLPLISLTLVAIFIYFILRWGYKKSRGLISLVLIGSVILLLSQKEVFLRFSKPYYELILGSYQGFLSSGGWNYHLPVNFNQDYYTCSFFLKYLFGTLFQFMLEPLPWHMYSFGMLAAYPMMLVWYIMIFFSPIGVIKIYRIKKAGAMVPLLVFLIIYVTITGMSVANIGTAVRFRDAIVPIVAILASCGLTRSRIRREGDDGRI